jgi:ABC-type lipoprotein export system ATPase subunit
MSDDSALVSLKDVWKRYDQPEGGDGVDVLMGVNLDVRAGQSLAIAGPSGCGKSTLLNIISALDRPTSGTVHLASQDLGALSDRQLAQVRNEKIGFVFQLHHLLAQCTVLENVLVPTLVGGRTSGRDAQVRARYLLERVGLSEHLSHRPGELSGGQRQRAAVARALINDPLLLLADEPTGSLDRSASDAVADLLVELNRDEGLTLILVSHSMDLADRMERTLHLRDGVLVASKNHK